MSKKQSSHHKAERGIKIAQNKIKKITKAILVAGGIHLNILKERLDYWKNKIK